MQIAAILTSFQLKHACVFPLALHHVLNGQIQGHIHWLCFTGAATWKDYNGCISALQSLHYIICYVRLEGVEHKEIVLPPCAIHKELPDPSEHETVVHSVLIYNDNVAPLGHCLAGACGFPSTPPPTSACALLLSMKWHIYSLFCSLCASHSQFLGTSLSNGMSAWQVKALGRRVFVSNWHSRWRSINRTFQPHRPSSAVVAYVAEMLCLLTSTSMPIAHKYFSFQFNNA